jgi:hypothetical protein
LDEINTAIKHFGTPKIGQTEFLNYLKSNRESYLLKMKNIDFLATNPAAMPKTSVADRSLVSPSSKSPNHKKQHLSDDCEIIAVLPLSNKSQSDTIDSTSSNTKNKKIFEEYAKMLQTQDFDKDQEKTNKEMRMSKLMSAMPGVEQARALRHLNEFKSKTESSSTPSTFTATSTPMTSSSAIKSTQPTTSKTNGDDDGLSKNLIWSSINTNKLGSIPQSPRTILLADPNYLSNHTYNPKLYTSNEDNDGSTKKIIFTNFEDDVTVKSNSYMDSSTNFSTFNTNYTNDPQDQTARSQRKRCKSITDSDEHTRQNL